MKLESRPCSLSLAVSNLDAFFMQSDVAGMVSQLEGLLDCCHVRTQLLLRWASGGGRASSVC